MRVIFAVTLLNAALALPNYPTTTPSYPDLEYPSDPPSEYPSTTGYVKDDYGGKRCSYVEEVEYTDRCEDYTDRICHTTYNEHCSDVQDQTCRATVSTSQTRPCITVNETLCTLKEEVSYEVVDAVVTVQKCSKGHARVCDTLAEMDFSSFTREHCINVPSLVCNTEEKTVYEKTCRTETKYDCDTTVYPMPSSGSSDYGQTTNDYGSPSYSPSSQPDYGTGSPSYKDVKCEKHQENRCSTTPRQVSRQTCSKHEERICQKLTERHPKPNERQVCRNEEKKVCRVEQTTQPKQIKKYTYRMVCRPMAKQVCEHVEKHVLVPSCVPTTRPVCQTTPSERCEDVPKKHCYQVPRVVRKEKCEDYHTEPSYPTDPYPEGHTANFH